MQSILIDAEMFLQIQSCHLLMRDGCPLPGTCACQSVRDKTRLSAVVSRKVQARGATCIGFLVPFVEYAGAKESFASFHEADHLLGSASKKMVHVACCKWLARVVIPTQWCGLHGRWSSLSKRSTALFGKLTGAESEASLGAVAPAAIVAVLRLGTDAALLPAAPCCVVHLFVY